MITKTQTAPSYGMYALVAAFAVAVSWLLHEFAHWATGTYLGYNMAMTLNTAYYLNEASRSTVHKQLIDAAGPLITLAEAVIVFLVMKQRQAKLLYVFLFTCFYSRLLATIISFLNPNDEARLSQSLGIGTFTLPLLMTAVLFVLLYRISSLYEFSRKFNIVNLVLIILFSSMIILSDQFFRIRLI